MLPSKKRRSSVARRSSYVNNDEFDISNNAFASAILGDDHSEDSSGVHREELMESIMNHEAAVEQESQRNLVASSNVSSLKAASFKPSANTDDYSFRPMTGLGHETTKIRGDRSDHTPSTNTRRSSLNSNSSSLNSSVPPQEQQRYTSQTKRGSILSTSSILASGLSSIKVQASELDKMFLQHKQSASAYGEKYEVPLPELPHEGRKAFYIRILIACTCMAVAAIITIYLGQGQFGQASASYLYNNYVLGGGPPPGNHVLNDDTTKNGSHLFEKVETLEKGFRRNVLGSATNHLPSLMVGYDGNIEVTVPHEMTEEHYIEFIWVKDVTSNKVVLARSYSPDESSAPSLKAKVPDGVKLRPYLFCNIHELWVGDEVQVP